MKMTKYNISVSENVFWKYSLLSQKILALSLFHYTIMGLGLHFAIILAIVFSISQFFISPTL